MKIFAYGSNMNIKRLRERVPSATKVCNASIDGYSFAFNKKSKDGSAKGNIEQTDNINDKVWGVVFEIDEKEKEKLDDAEGLGKGYNETMIDVRGTDGQVVKVQVYIADSGAINNSLHPYDWYKEYVVSGAKDNELPEGYIQTLNNFLVTEDMDKERRQKHFTAINKADNTI
ncbi:MAG: gamma-glutamylcyclotransferase [Sphingobacteriia bacterium]|jgi:gamma-glutamylcyclotransferase|nr:gamma-glutamylcyclotransferase [Sphingobacteriia bacterium]